jgi:hypothetical protein
MNHKPRRNWLALSADQTLDVINGPGWVGCCLILSSFADESLCVSESDVRRSYSITLVIRDNFDPSSLVYTNARIPALAVMCLIASLRAKQALHMAMTRHCRTPCHECFDGHGWSATHVVPKSIPTTVPRFSFWAIFSSFAAYIAGHANKSKQDAKAASSHPSLSSRIKCPGPVLPCIHTGQRTRLPGLKRHC